MPPQGRKSALRESTERPEVPVGGKLVMARRSFSYGGVEIDHGQLFRLRRLQNDEKLLRLGYVQPYDPKAGRERCGKCGAEFASAFTASRHYTFRHQRPPQNQVELERALERQEQHENQVSPIYMEQTAASRR